MSPLSEASGAGCAWLEYVPKSIRREKIALKPKKCLSPERPSPLDVERMATSRKDTQPS
jgi:hypothetical protein